MEIYVDADACPVKAEVETVATRHNIIVHVVSNGGIRPSRNPLLRTVIVDAGADAADDWIAERIQPGDITDAFVLGSNGKPFTEQTIGMALGMRDLHRHLREATGGQTFNAGFTKADRSRFLNALENAIQASKRRAKDAPPRMG